MTDHLPPATRSRVSRAGGRARAAKLDQAQRTAIAQLGGIAKARGGKGWTNNTKRLDSTPPPGVPSTTEATFD